MTYGSRAAGAAAICILDDDSFANLIRDFGSGDSEIAHGNGDDILVKLVERLGFPKTADAWRDLDKWYA